MLFPHIYPKYIFPNFLGPLLLGRALEGAKVTSAIAALCSKLKEEK
jgi:hypothetical protein